MKKSTSVKQTRTAQEIPKKADYYNDPTCNYMGYWTGREYEHAAEEMAISNLLRDKHFGNAVDVGGGYGRLSVFLQQFADNVTLVEPSQRQLDLAVDFLTDHEEIERKMDQAAALSFADSSVDLLVMIRVLHHLPDPTAEFREMARVLSDDGYAVIEVANYTHMRNRIKYALRGKRMPLTPVDVRSEDHRKIGEIPAVDHNPQTVIKQLAHAGLKVERILSVSNLRSPALKKFMPRSVLLAIEGILQPTLANKFFGPSVFFLVRKG